MDKQTQGLRGPEREETQYLTATEMGPEGWSDSRSPSVLGGTEAQPTSISFLGAMLCFPLQVSDAGSHTPKFPA